MEIRKAEYGSEEYEGLRALWCGVFGDGPDYVDAFYENFGERFIYYKNNFYISEYGFRLPTINFNIKF